MRVIARAAGGPFARAVTAGSVRVLMYHRFGDAHSTRALPAPLFARQLAYLKRHFRVRRLGDVVAALREGRPLDDRTIVVTIDDGYADVMTHAYPALVRHEVPASIFVVSRFLDGGLWLWFDEVHYILMHAAAACRDVEVGDALVRLDLRSPPARERAWSAIGEHLMCMNTAARRAAVTSLGAALDVQLPARPTSEYGAMTWDDCRRIDPALVEIGSHTCTHPVLSHCTEAELHYELHQSRLAIEQQLRRPVTTLAYPHGAPADYDERAMAMAKQAGYSGAAVAHGALIDHRCDLFQLERLSAAADFGQFCSTVNGVEFLANRYRAWRAAAF